MDWKARVTKSGRWWDVTWFRRDGSPGVILSMRCAKSWREAIQKALAGPPDTTGWRKVEV